MVTYVRRVGVKAPWHPTIAFHGRQEVSFLTNMECSFLLYFYLYQIVKYMQFRILCLAI